MDVVSTLVNEEKVKIMTHNEKKDVSPTDGIRKIVQGLFGDKVGALEKDNKDFLEIEDQINNATPEDEVNDLVTNAFDNHIYVGIKAPEVEEDNEAKKNEVYNQKEEVNTISDDLGI